MLPDMDMQIPSPVRDALELGLNSRHRAGSIFNTCIRASTDEDRYMINYAVNDARSTNMSAGRRRLLYARLGRRSGYWHYTSGGTARLGNKASFIYLGLSNRLSMRTKSRDPSHNRTSPLSTTHHRPLHNPTHSALPRSIPTSSHASCRPRPQPLPRPLTSLIAGRRLPLPIHRRDLHLKVSSARPPPHLRPSSFDPRRLSRSPPTHNGRGIPAASFTQYPVRDAHRPSIREP
ncbi:hypothetical protein C8Q70DRAFT_420811 [Cubamyces menziesii]|nr:hypothetical protein C8Q70DRAFT_420811 [Cubamyces menziesii]